SDKKTQSTNFKLEHKNTAQQFKYSLNNMKG
ncbi:unnamed protein product, partial [Rotaria magnacalcarata]